MKAGRNPFSPQQQFIKNGERDNSSLGKQVFKYIEDAVLNGIYKQGDLLVESKLIAELGVSRTPIREAVAQLEHEGLVQIVPHRGAVVRGISQKDIQDIYTVRIMVEGLAARWAAEHIDAAQLKELKAAIDLEEFYTSKNEIDHLIRLDSSFHQVIYKASKSTPLMYMLKTFHHYIQRARTQSIGVPGRSQKALEEQQAIYEAIKDGRGDLAEQLTASHISNARENILQAMEMQAL